MEMNCDSGFDRKRFINYNSDSFDCSICSYVPREPRECVKCDSIYCRQCIEQKLKESNDINGCCQKETIANLSKKLQSNYNDLQLKCQNCQRGINITLIDQHEIECNFIKQCINYEYCNNTIPIDNYNDKFCGVSCQLSNLIKDKKDISEIYKVLKEFFSTNPIQSEDSIGSKDAIQNIMSNQTTSGSNPITIRWDKQRMGSSMILTDGDQKVFLKEQAFIFKSIVANYGFESGIVYWEIEADDRTENELKIGVTTQRDFNFNSSFSDYEFGWAYYGQASTRHNQKINGPSFGKRFKNEGTLGICLNMNQGTLMYSLNGEYMGCAFKDEKLKRGPIYPAVTLLHCAGCKIVSGKPVPQIFLQ